DSTDFPIHQGQKPSKLHIDIPSIDDCPGI
ncbi:hypothetical protein ACS0PU_003275, partial [Formica fusca]